MFTLNQPRIFLRNFLFLTLIVVIVLFGFRNYFYEGIVMHIDKSSTLQTVSFLKEPTNDCTPSTKSFLKEPKPFVALASFPGSGNTWTRQLLEALTGIHTGSIYTDGKGDQIGSRRCPLHGEVYIIKTHALSSRITHPYCKEKSRNAKHLEKAIVILRNPYDAMIAEFNRQKGGGLNISKQSEFKSSAWTTFVTHQVKVWAETLLYWTKSFQKPYHVLVYERLKANTSEELNHVANFLQIIVTDQKVKCLLATEKPKYQRTGKPDWLNKETLFNQTLRQTVNNEILRTLSNVNKNSFISNTLENYLLE